MNSSVSTGSAVNRGVHRDAATNRLLAIMAGRYDGNGSMAIRAALRLASKAWSLVESPPQEAST